jgi:hypothetical protein
MLGLGTERACLETTRLQAAVCLGDLIKGNLFDDAGPDDIAAKTPL